MICLKVRNVYCQHLSLSIPIASGYITWGKIHKIYEFDTNLQSHLKKYPKLSYQALQLGNNKQNVSLPLSEFDKITVTASSCYFPDCTDFSEMVDSCKFQTTVSP